MSDEKRQRGGCFTFMLALAAFVMSAAAIYQINQANIEDKLHDVAERVGYGSVEAFSRTFKRTVGSSPGKWRTSR